MPYSVTRDDGYVRVEKLEAQCFDCEIKTMKTGRGFKFLIGRTNGFDLSATFEDGTLTIKKVLLDDRAALPAKECEMLYRYCRTPGFRDPAMLSPRHEP